MIALREATPADAGMVFEWRNLPEIVQLGTTQRTVEWPEHQAWFADAIKRSDRMLLIVYADGDPAGQIRFDWVDPRRCDVSIYLLDRYRGRGLGVEALRLGCRRVFEERPGTEQVVAFIRSDNERSARAFQAAGFSPSSIEPPPGHKAFSLAAGDADPFRRTAQFFDSLVARHGSTLGALDYGGPESQRARFEVLAAAFDVTGASVLDVGCGLAHLADFLEERYEGVRYQGIDVSPAMVEQARRRRPDLRLECGNIHDSVPGEFDVVYANGIFYLLGGQAPTLMRELVERMWSLARRGLAFTSLSTWGGEPAHDEFQADPLETIEFCRTLTPSLSLRHDYLPHDFAVILRRT